ncbi:ABC transporter permease [Microbacterium atlanticum]|uniref:ABC transporter permease n=1 Tax=Microbacterium atlanticum TaxID=2782168 RepID=UPI001888AEBF|nr:ABC transporter permease [Microbacterium atlanticum]
MNSRLIHYAKLIGSSLILLLVTIVLVFLLLELAPGNVVDTMIGQTAVSPEFRAALEARYGLNEPVFQRLLIYLGNVLTGNLGTSAVSNQPVLEIILGRFVNTLYLVVPALILSTVLGISLGAIAARTRSKLLDNTISYTSLAAFSIPTFWLGMMLVLVFSIGLGWLPAQGMKDYTTSAPVSITHLVLPVTALALSQIAFTVRVMRTTTIEVLGQDYIDTARSKGLSRSQVVRNHAILNSMLPMISIIGYNAAWAVTGVIFVERVFGWPGMGLLVYDAINSRDTMLVMGIVIFSAALVIIINIITDVAYGWADPRLRAPRRVEARA